MKYFGLKRMIPIFAILWTIVILSNFSSDIIAQEINVIGDHNAWTYQTSSPGLKQFGIETSTEGQLFYKNKPVPKGISYNHVQITNNLGTFEFQKSKDSNSEQGYRKISDTKSSEAKFCQPPDTCHFSSDDLQTYYGTRLNGVIGEKKDGTPDDWVFIVLPGMKRPVFNWVNPDRLNEFSEKFKNYQERYLK